MSDDTVNNTQCETPDKRHSLVISEDKMLAVLEAFAPVEIPEEEILRHIEEEGIVAGVDAQAVRDFVENCAKGEGLIRVPLAKGTEPQDGKDGEARWAHMRKHEDDMGDSGRIDWYEQSDLISVTKDDTIVEVLPSTEGTDGVDVFGEAVKSKDGKPVVLRAGPNVLVSDDGRRFTSTVSGMLIIKGTSLRVNPIYKVSGNVDFETGNIDFGGQVAIGGNVLDLFKVRATGNIAIGGCVEGATLESKGAITIKGGIAGKNKCTINLDGDLTTSYINSASVKCKGDVTVNIEVLNSKVEAGGTLTVKQKGIIGGHITVAGRLECSALGSEAGPPTNVELGKDTAKESRLNFLHMKERSLSAKVKELAGKVSTLERIKDRLPADKRELLTEMFYDQQEKQTELEEVRAEVRCLMDDIRELLKNASLLIKEMIYPGVVIKMGGVRKEIVEHLQGPITVKFDVAKRRILLLSKRS